MASILFVEEHSYLHHWVFPWKLLKLMLKRIICDITLIIGQWARFFTKKFSSFMAEEIIVFVRSIEVNQYASIWCPLAFLYNGIWIFFKRIWFSLFLFISILSMYQSYFLDKSKSFRRIISLKHQIWRVLFVFFIRIIIFFIFFLFLLFFIWFN